MLGNLTSDGEDLSEFDLYADSIRLSMMLTVCMLTVFLIVRIRFGEEKITTLTLQPYYIALFYCLTQIALTLLTELNHTIQRNG